jgi:hypothetical protein
MFSMPEDKNPYSIPERGRRPIFKAREGSHSKAKPVISLLLSPEHKVGKKIIHYTVRGFRVIAHKVYGEFLLFSSRPNIGKGYNFSILSHNPGRKALQVIFVEEP